MSDPYEKVKGGRLSFKGGVLASRSKSIDKKSKKNKKKKKKLSEEEEEAAAREFLQSQEGAIVIDDGDEEGPNTADKEGGESEILYTIDAAKRMKYDQLFPVEAKKFGYDPNSISTSKSTSVEQALDDRVKKKADRYCK